MSDTPAPPPPALKVAIVGAAPTSRMLAPYSDPSWQIWTCSGANAGVVPRVDMWFEMHAIIEMMSGPMRPSTEPMFKWLREQTDRNAFQCVMIDAGTELGGPNDIIPKAIPYPRDEMVQLFGRDWFTSSVAYMMALAIARGAKQIGLWGVDMAADQEHYEAQRAGCRRFIEIARGSGIEVVIPYESSLAEPTPMYGYWEGSRWGRRLTVVGQEIEAQFANANAEQQRQRDLANFFAGAREQIRYFKRTWTDGMSDVEPQMGNIAEIAAAMYPEPEDQPPAPPAPSTT